MPLRIQEPDVLRSIQTGLGIRDRFGTAELDDTLYSVAIVKDLTEPDVFKRPTSRLCASGNIATPAAGIQANAVLTNPSSSGTVAEVLMFGIVNREVPGTPYVYFLELMYTAPTGTSIDGTLCNTRAFGSTERAACEITSNVNANQASGLRIWAGGAGAEQDVVYFPRGLVLDPGVHLACNVQNNLGIDFQISWMWRETSIQLGR